MQRVRCLVLAFFVTVSVILSAVAQTFVSSPPAGTVLSDNLNEPGPTITCIGYNDLGGVLYQQRTLWSVTQVGKSSTFITTSNSTFMLSNDTIAVNGLPLISNLTILNVTSNLDHATITCSNDNVPANVASFVVRIYRKSLIAHVSQLSMVCVFLCSACDCPCECVCVCMRARC